MTSVGTDATRYRVPHSLVFVCFCWGVCVCVCQARLRVTSPLRQSVLAGREVMCLPQSALWMSAVSVRAKAWNRWGITVVRQNPRSLKDWSHHSVSDLSTPTTHHFLCNPGFPQAWIFHGFPSYFDIFFPVFKMHFLCCLSSEFMFFIYDHVHTLWQPCLVPWDTVSLCLFFLCTRFTLHRPLSALPSSVVVSWERDQVLFVCTLVVSHTKLFQ